MSEHTPGPWDFEPVRVTPRTPRYARGGYVVNGPDDGTPIRPRVADCYGPRAKENATFIASAPSLAARVAELGEVLADLLAVLDSMGLSTMPGDTMADLREECKSARAALARK